MIKHTTKCLMYKIVLNLICQKYNNNNNAYKFYYIHNCVKII